VVILTSFNLIRNESVNRKFLITRGIYILALIITILLGLGSRKYSFFLPNFLAENSGDALWAMMIYFGFRFLLVRQGFAPSIWLSLSFCFGIEFSQLYHAEWINQLRSTTLGALILGKGFLWVDLIRYSTGIVFAALLDKLALIVYYR
jgi:hypothetical protein